MTEIVIRQSGKRGSGFVIAAIILIVFGIARFGPKLAKFDAQDREDQERQRVRQIMESTSSEDWERLSRTLKESGAVDKALENIHRAVEEPSQSNSSESSTPVGPAALPESERVPESH